MDDKDWLKGLQNKMKDYEEPAPEGLWEDIESSVFHGKKRRVIALPVFWRSVAAAAVVALGVFAGLRLSQPVVENPLDKSQGMDKSQGTWLPVSLLQSTMTEAGSLLWKLSGTLSRKPCWQTQGRSGNVRPRPLL